MASTSGYSSEYSNSTNIEEKNSGGNSTNSDMLMTTSSTSSNLRPRARTDASALLNLSSSNSTSTMTLESSHDCSDNGQNHQHSPKNLKKLTAAIRANINNNVARVNRPLSTRGLENEGITVTTNTTNPGSNTHHDHGHHNSSPPMNSGKKR